MLTYICRIISLLFCLWAFQPAFSAEKEKAETAELKPLFNGFYVDYDLGDLLMSAIETQRFGMNASIVFDLRHTIYPAFEMGYATYDGAPDYSYDNTGTGNQTAGVKYDLKGTYYKVGFNINLLEKDFTKKMTPYGYVGVRYAIAPRYEYEISGFKKDASIWPNDDYVPAQSGKTTAQWAEFLAGVNTPIFKGFCLGAELRYRSFLKIDKVSEGDYTINQSYAPGFGDSEDGSWGFRYTISYFFH